MTHDELESKGLAVDGQLIADRYQVLRTLGEGGMGRVVAARNLLTGRVVALKITRASILDRLELADRCLREARAASLLAHANVIDVLDVVLDDEGAPVIVMELLEGLPLSAVLRELERLSLPTTAQLLVPILDALDHVHQARLVHRDVKPSNLFLARQHDARIVPKLLDFGIVKVLLDASMAIEPGQTSTGALLGTPHYMSPEQVSGQRDVDERSDVWAAGAVVYECLSGVRPFAGENFGQVFAAILMAPIVPLVERCPSLPEELCAAVMAALTRDRNHRMARVSELLAVLDAHVHNEDAQSEAELATIDTLLSTAVEAERDGVESVTQLAFDSTSIPPSRTGGKLAPPSAVTSRREDQEIEFCESADGVRIAYVRSGSGPALVWMPYWLSHLELNWRSPLWRPWLVEAARDHRLVSLDQRGTGLSDWNVAELGTQAWLRDLEAVVDAAGLDRFALIGFSQGSIPAIAYAAKHPDRVTHLVLQSGLCRGWRRRGYGEARLQQIEAYGDFVCEGWGRDDSEYREQVIGLYMKDGTEAEWDWFNRILRATTSADNARRLMAAFGDMDVSEELAAIQAPTLVVHARGDPLIQVEHGREIAAGIPSSRLVELDSNNHILQASEPAWVAFWAHVRAFLATTDGTLIDEG